MIVIYLLGLKRLLARPLVVVLSIVGIAAGVGLVVSVNAVLSSVRASVEEINAIDEGSTLTITARSPLGMPAALVETATNDPDVVHAEPQLLRPYLVNGRETVVIGRQDVPSALVGSANAGDSFVDLAGSAGPITIAVTPAPNQLVNINDGHVLLLSLADAQEFTDRPATIDTIALTTRPGTETAVAARLGEAVGPAAYVAPADAQKEFALAQMEQVQSPLMFMAMVALVAGGFLVFNTVQNSARQQERELAVLRAVGGSRRQIATGLMLEAVVLGVLGSLLGVVLGGWLGRRIVDALPVLVDSVAGITIRYHADWLALPSAVMAGVAVAIASAVLPIVRTVRARPDQVLARRPPPQVSGRRRLRVLPFALVIGVVGLLTTRSNHAVVAQIGLALVLVAFLAGGFGLSDQLAQAAGALAARTGHLGSLVQADIGQAGRRVWGTMAAVFTAVMIALAVGGAARNQGDTLRVQFDMARDSDLWVATTTSDDLPIDFYYPADTAEQVAGLPGVEAVYTTTVSTAVQDDRRFVVFATDGPVRLPQVSLASPEAIEQMVTGREAIITHQFARALDLEVGDEMELLGVHGPLVLRVAAITRTTSVSKWGTVNIGRDTYVEAFGDPGVTGMEVRLSEGADIEQISGKIEGILGDTAPVVVATGDEFFDTLIASVDDATNVFLVVTTAIVGVASLGTLNAAASSVVERRRQLGVLRSIGATPRQIRRIVSTEVLAAGAVGATIGLVCGNVLHRLAVDITDRTTPFPEDYSFSWPTFSHAVVSAALAVGIGGLLAAWQGSRARIADALAYE